MAKFIPNPEVAEQKKQTALKSLEAGVAAIQDSDSFKKFLKAQSVFWKYSFGNVILIASQRPDATRVAGFKAWNKVGRYVKKGAKGITIFVPMRKKIAGEDDNGDATESTRLFFGTGSVFDISDTDGEDISGPEWIRVDGDSHAHLYDAVAEVVASRGIKLDQNDETRHADGYFNPRDQRIWIKPTLSANAKVTTLIHELAHASDEALVIEEYAEHRGEAESLAEGVAYVVAQHFGLDSGSESFVYVAKWSEKPEVLKTKLAQIQRVAARIIDEIEAVGADAPAEEVAA